MKNFTKFTVGARLILAIVLCLPFRVHATADIDQLPAFVLACDDGYAAPTAVALQSLKETNPYGKIIVIFVYEIRDENKEKLQRIADDTTSIFVVDLCEKKWEKTPTFGGQEINLVESIMGVGRGRWGNVNFLNCQHNPNAMYRFMINLRLFLPDIWASGLLPEELWSINHFLWLDSDLIIYKDLSFIFEICKNQPNQPMFGVNLLYDLYYPNCYLSDTMLVTLEEHNDYDNDETFCMSGGVIFWNIKKVINDCILISRNVFQKIISETGQTDGSVDDKNNKTQNIYDTEEHAFTEYSTEQALCEEIPVFSLLPLSCNVTATCFQCLDKEDMAIFHWDGIKKPWQVTCADKKSDFITEQNAKWWEIAARTEFYRPSEE